MVYAPTVPKVEHFKCLRPESKHVFQLLCLACPALSQTQVVVAAALSRRDTLDHHELTYLGGDSVIEGKFFFRRKWRVHSFLVALDRFQEVYTCKQCRTGQEVFGDTYFFAPDIEKSISQLRARREQWNTLEFTRNVLGSCTLFLADIHDDLGFGIITPGQTQASLESALLRWSQLHAWCAMTDNRRAKFVRPHPLGLFESVLAFE
jgi:hypothetical protein